MPPSLRIKPKMRRAHQKRRNSSESAFHRLRKAADEGGSFAVKNRTLQDSTGHRRTTFAKPLYRTNVLATMRYRKGAASMTENRPRMAICYAILTKHFPRTTCRRSRSSRLWHTDKKTNSERKRTHSRGKTAWKATFRGCSCLFAIHAFGKSLKTRVFSGHRCAGGAVPRRYGLVRAHDSVCCAARHRA